MLEVFLGQVSHLVSLENHCFFTMCTYVIKPVLMFIQRLSLFTTL